MKKGDLTIFVAVCTLAAVLSVIFFFFKSDGKTVLVKTDNKIIAEYPLNADREIKLEHNSFIIKNGEVFMDTADCKNQICVKTGKISKRGECIVCLPNMVVLEIR